jgi:hypothetical protein
MPSKVFFSMVHLRLLLLVVCMFSVQLLKAQSDITPKGMETPEWVTMMDNPMVNYFEAIKAYQEYWNIHVKPTEEEEEMGNPVSSKGKSARELQREEREREREESRKKKLSGSALEQAEYLKYQCKRFENWALEVKPWVQENGHILTYEERTAIWKQQQEENKK